MGLLSTGLACLAIAGGCGGPAVEAPPSVDLVTLSYERSGGLRPTSERLVIRTGRRAKASVKVGSEAHAASFKVGVKAMRSLRAALERADFQAIVSPGPNPSCADCFLYAIRYRGHQVRFDEAGVPEGLGPVVARLERMIAAHLPFH
jgi:hypothetical protein